jgi:hypothetical protein
LLGLLACSGIGLSAIYFLDPEAFQRVLLYARSSLPDSMLGNLLASEPVVRRSLSMLGVLIPLAVFVYLLRVLHRRRTCLQTPERTFWLANTLFAYLLVLPLFDLDLVPRFILFLPLPMLVILGYFLRFHVGKRLGVVLVSLVTLGVTTMLFGEVMEIMLRSPNKEAIHADLLELREQHHLTDRDFILTRYGVNPTCNWFLGTKSGLITTLHKSDFQLYERVFVLNPEEGSMAPAQLGDREEKNAYQIMRRNVPLPADAVPLVQTEHLRFYELHTPPKTWQFDDDGRWTGNTDE